MDNLSNMGNNTDSSTKSTDNVVVSMGGEVLITPALLLHQPGTCKESDFQGNHMRRP